jgi:nitronate monooxygenase
MTAGDPRAFVALLSTPLIAAPMAGGVTTVDLALATTRGQAFSFLAAGYKTPEAMAAEIAAFRSATPAPFGVNLFLPSPALVPAADLDKYRRLIQPEADRLGVALGTPGRTDDWYAEKLELLLADPVPAVSFTFGLPSAEVVTALHKAGTVVIGTVTNPAEAVEAYETDIDVLCVQSAAAGGHRATFGNYPGSTLAMPDLLRAVGDVAGVPMIAAGGIASSEHIARALHAGAVAVQVGTAFLAAAESGAPAAHKAALAASQARTAVTRAFSGRPARGLMNRFMKAYEAAAPAAYPQVHDMTVPIRRAGAAAGDSSVMALWAGTGHQQARTDSAQQIADDLLRRL